MNQTTQFLTESLKQLEQLTPTQILQFQQIFKQATLLSLRAIKDLLLLYPINLIILIVGIYTLVWKILSSINKDKVQVYWPNQHIQAYDQHIKNLKKDIRETQNQVLNFNRKLDAKFKDQSQNSTQSQLVTEPNTLRTEVQVGLQEMIQQGLEMKEISNEFLEEIKTSESKIMQKLKKYKK